MKFRTAFLILSCSASFAATAPANIDHTDGELLTKRGKAADCQFLYVVLENLFWIKMWGWGDDYGRGLLDNIRGQCGPVVGWVCDYHSSSGAWEAGGSLPLGIRSHCVEDAIWLASGGIEGVQCHSIWV
ncbi:hypothetical protein yc1106_06760 [Curvularia clavata]|uniref:Uncharacterized protein n=1 Tax=Curvularia clavata TaxID=95742 RepID=A0A9Q8ZC46_CURCL|nr:hypothetical protein yc1106_06760 [Curvularia clavata]